MVTIIIMALALALLQIWIIPMAGALIINIKSKKPGEIAISIIGRLVEYRSVLNKIENYD